MKIAGTLQKPADSPAAPQPAQSTPEPPAQDLNDGLTAKQRKNKKKKEQRKKKKQQVNQDASGDEESEAEEQKAAE